MMNEKILIDLLGWLATGLVVLGFFLNSRRNHFTAMILWIIGDIIWIYYDWLISNWSHAALSSIIIGINIYGIYRRPKRFKPMSKRTMQRYIDLFE